MKRYFLFFVFAFLVNGATVRADETVAAAGTVWNKPDITILATEKVTWTWGSGHTSTSTTAANCVPGGPDPWNFTTPGQNKIFTVLNDYNYMCSIHCGMGMKGIVRVVDFGISCSPDTITAAQGSSGNTTCTITSMNGLILPVTLATTGLPAGVTVGFSQNPVTPPANMTADSTVTLNIGGSVTPGSYPFKITGTATSGSTIPKVRTKMFDMTLNVTAGPDFTINCNPTSWIMNADGSDTNTCTIGSVGGFSNTVDLGCSGNPSGSTCAFSVDPVTPPSNGTVTTDVTVDAQGLAAAGQYNLAISGTGTPGTRTFNGTVVVRDFSVDASPTSLIAPPGGTANTTAVVTSLQGFNSAVTMACTGLPAGATCDFTPPSPTPPPSGAINSDVTVNVGAAVPENTYPFQITGTNGGLVRSKNLSILVTTAQDFSIGCTPAITNGQRNDTATTTCTIGSINAFIGNVNLGCTGLPAGVNCSFTPNPVSPPNGGTDDSVLTLTIDNTVLIGSYPFQVTGSDGGSLNHSANVTLNVVPLYADYFDDTDVTDWTFIKGTWTSPTGALIGNFKKKAIALGPYTMLQNRTVEGDVRSAGGVGNQVSLYGWYIDKKNYVEVMMKQTAGRWVLKQLVNGVKGAKGKAVSTTSPNTTYHVALTYDGTTFHVSIDGVEIITEPGPPPPSGSPGFKVKATTGTFNEIFVYQ